MTIHDSRWPRGESEMASHIREFDWAATPLGPTDAWPRSLKAIVDLMLRSPGIMSLVWGPEAIHLYNDGFIDLLREHPFHTLGRSAYETFARSRNVFADDVAAGMAGRSARLIGQQYPVLRNGRLEQAWFDVDYAPVQDDADTVAGVLWTLKETTAQHLAQQALRASETRHRLLIESWAQAVWETDGQGVVVADSPSWRAYTGQTLGEWLGDGWLDAIHPDDRAHAERQWREAVAARGLVDAEFRLRTPDGGWRWTNVRAAPVSDANGSIAKWFGLNIDIEDRKRAEAALRESEERLQLALEATELAAYEWDLDSDRLTVNGRFRVLVGVGAEEPITGAHIMESCVHPDDRARVDPDLARAMAGASDGKFVFEHRLSRLGPLGHPWVLSHGKIDFAGPGDARRAARVFGTLQDITARKLAEIAMRASEERFQQFARASAAGLWIRNADTLVMEFVSPAIEAIYGVKEEVLLGDVTRWAAMIVPDDRDVALAHLEAARRGETVVHEFRIQRPTDGAFRWIRNTDFPLRDNGHIPGIGGIAEDVTESKVAAEHSAVLLAELQHRVRNIMALLRSITNRTGERAESVAEYRDLMMGRMLAFARVQALLTRIGNVSVGIASLVHDEVSAQAQHADQYVIEGQDIALSPKAAEVLTLAIHELATNAVKYGALSVSDGRVAVRWSTLERRGGPWLSFDWTEEGAPARPESEPGAPRRRGFGSELIEGRIPYELRGRGEVSIEPGGARCHMEFPLQKGASILETGAPQQSTVFGGAIDMTGEPDLTGRRILVIEDDYYLATDTARALRGAGAEVVGPCATEDDARAELNERRPDAVVVDINLGQGPSFKLAETLKDSGIPFVFTTGYDAGVIPAKYAGIERLQKPIKLQQIVGAIAKLPPAA